MYLFLSTWFSFFFFFVNPQISLWILFLYIHVSWEAAYKDVMTLWHTLEIQEQMVFSTNLFIHSHKVVSHLPLLWNIDGRKKGERKIKEIKLIVH